MTTDLVSVSSSTLTSETSDTTVTMSAKSRKSVKRKTSTRSVGKGKGKGKVKDQKQNQMTRAKYVTNQNGKENSGYVVIGVCHGTIELVPVSKMMMIGKYTEHDIEYLCPLCQ